MRASGRERHLREMERLREAYLRELPEKVASLRRDAVKLWESRQGHAQALDALNQTVHRLAGSAAVFGLLGLSEAARELYARLADAPLREAATGDFRTSVEGGIARVEAAMPAGSALTGESPARRRPLR